MNIEKFKPQQKQTNLHFIFSFIHSITCFPISILTYPHTRSSKAKYISRGQAYIIYTSHYTTMSDTNTNNTSIKVLENPESGSSVVANTEATNDSSKHDTEHEQKDVEMEAQDNEKETRTEQPASPPKSALKNTTTSNSNSKNVKLPVARIKRIVKQDGDVVAISTPAVYAVAAATELFVNYFTQQAYMRASSSTSSASTSADGSAAGKKKRVAYKDFANSVEQLESLQFLSRKFWQIKKISIALRYLKY